MNGSLIPEISDLVISLYICNLEINEIQPFVIIGLYNFTTTRYQQLLLIEQEQVTSFARVSMARRSIFFELVPLSLEISVHDSFVAC